MGDPRFITLGEYELLHPIFRDTLQYERVLVKSSGMLQFSRIRGIVLGRVIRIARDAYYPDYSRAPFEERALFAHEVTHIWQRQNLPYHEGRAMMEHVKFRHEVYHYDVDPDAELTDYRFEQQGAIVQDYLHRKLKLPKDDVWPVLEAIIAKSVKRIGHGRKMDSTGKNQRLV